MAIAVSAHGGLGIIHRFNTVQEQAGHVAAVVDAGEQCGAAIGVKHDPVERGGELLDAGADVLVIDIAHGHLDACIDTVQQVRAKLGDVPLVAGNVATEQAVHDLASAGVDTVKVGIGPGSHCTTRNVAGAGVPQLTAVMDCADAAAEYDLCTIADGGIRTPGECVKALVGGADTVMLGGLLMGTDEAPGERVKQDGSWYVKTRGMASDEARAARGQSSQQYAAEGVAGLTPYTGSVDEVLQELRGGLRSGISYCGADTLSAARENGEFIRASVNARDRSGPHGHGLQLR